MQISIAGLALTEIVSLHAFEEKEASLHELKRKIMSPAIYERDLGKFTFSIETLLLVMVVELGKNCLKNALARLLNLPNKPFHLRLR